MGLSMATDNAPVGGLGLAPASTTAPGHGGILTSAYAPEESPQTSRESLFLSDDEEMDVLTDTESLTSYTIPYELPSEGFQDIGDESVS